MNDFYIYCVMLPCGNVKIGMTCNVKHRMQTMSSNVGKVDLLKVWGGYDKDECRFIEKWFQAHLWPNLAHGREIFSLCKEPLERILGYSKQQLASIAYETNADFGGYA